MRRRWVFVLLVVGVGDEASEDVIENANERETSGAWRGRRLEAVELHALRISHRLARTDHTHH